MSIRERPAPPYRNWLALGLGLVALVGLAVYLLWPVPQLGVDDRVFHTVDALYTAVRARNETQLTRCAERLDAARRDGTLPTPAADFLDGVIAQARAGSWSAAAERLYGFMLAQRREGVTPGAPAAAGSASTTPKSPPRSRP